MPILIVGRGSAARVVEVESDPFTIGRSPDCHLVLEGSRVSRQHGELTRRGSRHVLRDRGCTRKRLADPATARALLSAGV